MTFSGTNDREKGGGVITDLHMKMHIPEEK